MDDSVKLQDIISCISVHSSPATGSLYLTFHRSTCPSKPSARGSLVTSILPVVSHIVIGILTYAVYVFILKLMKDRADRDAEYGDSKDLRIRLQEEVRKFVEVRGEDDNQDGIAKLERLRLDTSGVSSVNSLRKLCSKIAKCLSIRSGVYCYFPFCFPGRGWDGRKYVLSVITEQANDEEDTHWACAPLSIPDIQRKLKESPVVEGVRLAIVCEAIRLRQEHVADARKIFVEILMFVVVHISTNFAFSYFGCLLDQWAEQHWRWSLARYVVVYSQGDLVSKVPTKKILDWLYPNLDTEMESAVRQLKVDLAQAAWEEGLSDTRHDVKLWLSEYFRVYQEVAEVLKDDHCDPFLKVPFGIKYSQLVSLALRILPLMFRNIEAVFERYAPIQPAESSPESSRYQELHPLSLPRNFTF